MYTFEAYIFDEKHGVDKTYKLLFLSPILWIKNIKKVSVKSSFKEDMMYILWIKKLKK